MFELLKATIPECVGGLLALLCAIVGAKIATKSGEKQEKIKSLQSAYADVFTGYYSCVLESSDKNILLFVTAVERAMLICSENSAQIMRNTLAILLVHPVDIGSLGENIQALRASAKEDMRHAKRK